MSRAARKPAGKRGAPARGRANPLLRLSPQAWWRTWAVLGWAATLLLVGWGLWRLEDWSTARQRFVSCRAEWATLPAWLNRPENDPILGEIEMMIDLPPDADLTAPDLCQRVGWSLEQSAWVAKVNEVTKQADGTVRIDARFREPLAMVEVKGRAYLVDDEGVRLPISGSAAMRNPSDPNEPLLITGVVAPLPDVGRVWAAAGTDPNAGASPDLAAGLALVRCLQSAYAAGRLQFRPWLTAVDVGNFGWRERPLDGQLRIRTIYPRYYINWGEPPGEEYPVEASVHRKLDLLGAVYAQHGQLPEMNLDVRGADLRAQDAAEANGG